ncbi:MAG TPA: flagellar protein export ATPase FliI [Thermodesulfobacteriota bacterium]|nr:flagellar protein export ATPase FliI [Thermodesulfobacteriota bacterium]
MSSKTPYRQIIQNTTTIQRYGRVSQVIGLVVEGIGPCSAIGDMCQIKKKNQERLGWAEVVGFRDNKMLLMPLGETRGIEPGCLILPLGRPAQASVGRNLLGRVLDALGKPIDQKGPIASHEEYPLYSQPSHPLLRRRIAETVDVGIRSINGLLTLGKGQRIAIFSGSGVGKSTLLGMIARHTTVPVNVVALIGERSREVREFIEKDLGEEGLKRSVVIVATSDQPPLIRMRGAYLAASIAEYFRDQGKDVLLMMDSITRFAMASREVGLAVGEPPTTKGYTPSVFAQLPKLLERVGTTPGRGSITGIFNVLVEADDVNDPIADAIRSIVDGHIVLSRELANQNHYPAIDILGSISRVMTDIVSSEQLSARNQLVSLMATYKKAEDLIQIGAYVAGSNPQIDEAIRKTPEIDAFLRQAVQEKADFRSAVAQLKSLFSIGSR